MNLISQTDTQDDLENILACSTTSNQSYSTPVLDEAKVREINEIRLRSAGYEIVEELTGGKSRNSYKVRLADEESNHYFVAKVKIPSELSEVHAQKNNNDQERNVQAVLNGVSGIPRLAYSRDDINVEHYIEGETLSTVKNFLTTRQKNEIAERLISTLANIHESGVAHRDIHPGNIIIGSSTKIPYLIDWEKGKTLDELAGSNAGLEAHETMAAARYMTPSVANGIVDGTFHWNASDAQRNDVHALAMSILEMYHGSLVMPHSFSSSQEDPSRLVLKRYNPGGNGFEERIDSEINSQEYQTNVKSALKSVPENYRSIIGKALTGDGYKSGTEFNAEFYTFQRFIKTVLDKPGFKNYFASCAAGLVGLSTILNIANTVSIERDGYKKLYEATCKLSDYRTATSAHTDNHEADYSQ